MVPFAFLGAHGSLLNVDEGTDKGGFGLWSAEV